MIVRRAVCPECGAEVGVRRVRVFIGADGIERGHMLTGQRNLEPVIKEVFYTHSPGRTRVLEYWQDSANPQCAGSGTVAP